MKSKREDGRVEAAKADPAFDLWIARQLHSIYDEVLAEEVPDTLLEVVQNWGNGEDAGKEPVDRRKDGASGCKRQKDG